MLKDKYASVLEFGKSLDIKDGYVREEAGKLKIGGVAACQYDSDRLWDKIKSHDGWQSEVEADINVARTDIYGYYTVESGDTLSKIAKLHFDDYKRYMDIFNINRDILDNPDLIKVGQKLKLPNK